MLQAVRFNSYAAFMTFDPFLGLFSGGKPRVIILDDDVMSSPDPVRK